MQPRAFLRRGFDRVERAADLAFGREWNPFAQLGALGWFLFWIVAGSGMYLFIFFDTGVTNAYASLEWISGDLWFHAGIARSFHRYASDLMVAVLVVHVVREFCYDRYRGVRWFSWLTGVPLIWLLYVSGITGYWLVWDELAQYVAITSAELLDWLPIFGEPIARNFLSPEALSDRFFTLMVFLHIAVPLMLLAGMWIHIQRIAQARVNPSRPLGGMLLGGLLIASLGLPATSQSPASLSMVPDEIGVDWFYLPLYPLTDHLPAGAIWGGLALFTIGLAALPWLPSRRELRPAEVTLDHCNGCARCVEDCPYAAITLVPRTDGKPFPHEVTVNPARCVACGICMGSCPSSTPFRRTEELVTGIDLPDLPLTEVRRQLLETAATLEGRTRVLIIACEHGAAAGARDALILPCVAMAPPSLIDYVISRGHAEGVVVAGCAEGRCQNRLGVEWTKQRFAQERDPYLRRRVPRERVETVWAGPTETGRFAAELAAFRARLTDLPPAEQTSRPAVTGAAAPAMQEAGE